MANLAPAPKFTAFDSNGDPLNLGKVYTYVSGGSTPATTYTNAGAGTSNANPVVLDSRGEANIWLDPLITYRFILKTSADVTLWTVDGIVGVPSVGNIQNGVYTLLGSVAGTNTITAVCSPVITAYAAGQLFQLIPAATNTGATTINLDGLGAKNIFSQGAACVGGELRSGVPVLVQYDGTRFNIIGPYVSGVKTYTPIVTLVGGAGNTVPVYSTNSGRYQEVGKLVFVDVLLDGDGGAEGAGSGVINVSLPITSGANFQAGYMPIGVAINNATEYMLYGTCGISATTIKLNMFSAATTQADLTGDEQNNATRQIRLHFFYERD